MFELCAILVSVVIVVLSWGFVWFALVAKAKNLALIHDTDGAYFGGNVICLNSRLRADIKDEALRLLMDQVELDERILNGEASHSEIIRMASKAESIVCRAKASNKTLKAYTQR